MSDYPYLGNAGAMRRLPLPTGDVEVTPDMGDNPAKALSGRTSVQKRLNLKRAWNIPYDFLPPADAALLLGFYQGLYGMGPFVLVDPSTPNVLSLDNSSMGARSFAPIDWAVSGGTFTRDTATAPPEAADWSGVLNWVPAANKVIKLLPPVASAAVGLPGEPCCVALFAKASSAYTASMQMVGYNDGGGTTTMSHAAALTTDWQPFAVISAARTTLLTSNDYVGMQLAVTTSPPAHIWVAAGFLGYTDALPDVWTAGMGVGPPRVEITSTPGRTVPRLGWSNHVLQVAE